MEITPRPPRAKVAPARRPINTPRDLLPQVEGRHVAIVVRRFGVDTYQDGEQPTPTADAPTPRDELLLQVFGAIALIVPAIQPALRELVRRDCSIEQGPVRVLRDRVA